MLINQDQPLEVFFAYCALVNKGAWASTVLVEGPGSTSPRWKGLGPHHLGGRALAHITFSGKYGGKTSCLNHHIIASALTLYTRVRAMVPFNMS